MQPPETIIVDTAKIACDGDADSSPHPRVYLKIAKEGFVDCPYCGKRFILKEGAHADAH
ncbi:MAG: zinc-finger domain-containing protein [Alphaproteobacteria bacterium]|nr:zinc-finger domain-containing protein [Alphaproteobacteria bacterium]